MSTGEVGVQGDGLVSLGTKMRDSAGVVNGQVQQVAMVAPTDTGFGYKTQGDAIHNGLLAVQQWLKDWSEATQLTGDAMGQTVVEVSTVDKENSDNTQQAAS
ncbi:hypothetical protein [Nocardia flavorosea]|uniref:Excreted virulence factor EspC (Type VII ESX diderm) n=1 Tax=Nocardia flavorosea TaxID=53429 RepID=A0A846Y917_9NOCA|nr:hypothetical protein [Nocardia flavorosea]NKY55653.1 hypothetical protein [Nocardia flavorosea]